MKKFLAFTTVVLMSLTALPAQANDLPSGLFGKSDPTYDGVYRQSIALIGLKSAKASTPTAAINWLTQQQCSDGGFMAFKVKECDSASEDSNSTAIAAIALKALGKTKEAQRAANWLVTNRNKDGGIGYNPLAPATAEWDPSKSDANSSGLMLAALTAIYPGKYDAAVAKHLAAYQLPCSDKAAGALDYQVSATISANDFATAQAIFGLTGSSLPISKKIVGAKSAKCKSITNLKSTEVKDVVTQNGLLYLSKRLTTNPKGLPSAFGPGTDWSATGWATLALVASGIDIAATKTAIATLADGAITWGMDGKTGAKPGAIGMMLILTSTLKLDSAHFGGLNLSKTLIESLN